MDGMILDIQHKPVEPRDEASPLGEVTIDRGAARATLLTPDEIDPERSYPLITVLHGAGRQDEMLVKACRKEPNRREALFLVPRSVEPTWDLIVGEARPDLEFLAHAYDLIYRRYPIDASRQALIGYSDGASYGISLGLSNPHVFDAVMAWAAGFVMVDRRSWSEEAPKPRIYLEYGSHDELFPFEQVAVPTRESLKRAGYDVTFSVDEGGRHWPSGYFQTEALDWYFKGRSR